MALDAAKRKALVLGAAALTLLLGFAAPAAASPPAVYLSETNEGVPPPGGILMVPPGATTLHLFIDGGGNPSSETPCSQGTGDDVCSYDLDLQGQNGLSITEFTPRGGVAFHLSGNTLGVVGGDPWFGELGPRKIGEVTVNGSDGGTLDLLGSSESANASLGLESIGPTTLLMLPEPDAVPTLIAGSLLLGWLNRRRHLGVTRRHRSRSAIATSALSFTFVVAAATSPARAQVSTDCGDIVADGVIDIQDLDTLRQFLAGDPAAPDLQSDPQRLAACDVSADGLCKIDDYARIRRYMLDLPGGMNETCPLSGSTYAPVILPPPTVDQVSPLATDQASVVLSGTADPNHKIRVTGAVGRPAAATDPDGIWTVEVPLALGQMNSLQVFRDHGAGYLSETVPVDVNQTAATGTAGVEGRVIDGATGTPLEGATIHLAGATELSDQFGLFEISDLPQGLVVLLVEHPNYVPTLALAGAGILAEYAPGGNTDLVVGLTPRQTPVTIGSGGGTVTAPSGIELVVPAGSLPGDTEISLTDIRAASGIPFGPLELVDIGPGPIVFDPPATLRIPTVAGLSSGTVIDFEQVDHSSGSVIPALGVVSSGYIEVPVFATNGDGDGIIPRIRWFDTRRVNLNDKREFKVVAPCEAPIPFHTIRFNRALLESDIPCPGICLEPLRIECLIDSSGEIISCPLYPDPVHVWGEAMVRSASSEWGPQTVNVSNIQAGTIKTVKVHYLSKWVRAEFDPVPPPGAKSALVQTYRVLIPQQLVDFKIEERPNSACDKKSGAGWGDPHMIRFDHAGEAISHSRGDGRFNFQATGEFVLFESTETDMVAQVRYEARGSTSVTTAAALNVDGDILFVTPNSPELEVHVNGVPTPLTVGVPVALPAGGEIERGPPWGRRNRDNATVRLSDGSDILIVEAGYLDLFPKLAPRHARRVRGLLGNANGILVDDLNLRDGTPADPADLYTSYADSWRISQAESLFEYEPGEDTSTYNGTPADEDFTPDDLDPAVAAAAEASCMAAGVTEEPTLSDCIIDVAVLEDEAAADGAADALDEVPPNGFYVAVPGDANIFGAGLGSAPDFGGGGGVGSLPVEIPLPAGTGRSLRVLDSAGTISVSPGGTAIPPDGLPAASVEWGTWGGYAGPSMSRTAVTTGVFVNATAPPAVTAAPYTCGQSEQFIAPEIGQIFCLGDGLSAFGEPQHVLVPDAATRLFLGYIEGIKSQVLESDVHHVGDNTISSGLFALAPSPEGVTWTTAPFDAPTALTNARVLIDLVQTNFSTNAIQVNGQPAALLPSTGNGTTEWSNDHVIFFDPALLQASGNTITIVAGASGSNADDFLFRNLRLETGTGTTATVDTDVHYLGDQDLTVGLFNGQTQEGISWSSAPFDVPDARAATGAMLRIDLVQTNFTTNEVRVNGEFAGHLPSTGDDTSVWSDGQGMAFAPVLLRETGNVISIVADTQGSNTDDFLFRNVKLSIETVQGPPGGYGDNTGMHEFVIEVMQ
jgi:hypothetical protein